MISDPIMPLTHEQKKRMGHFARSFHTLRRIRHLRVGSDTAASFVSFPLDPYIDRLFQEDAARIGARFMCTDQPTGEILTVARCVN